MLRCTIELIPFGDESAKRILSEVLIANDGTGDESVGNYRVTMYDNSLMLGGRVENHARLQHGPAFLVARAIDACLKAHEERDKE